MNMTKRNWVPFDKRTVKPATVSTTQASREVTNAPQPAVTSHEVQRIQNKQNFLNRFKGPVATLG